MNALNTQRQQRYSESIRLFSGGKSAGAVNKSKSSHGFHGLHRCQFWASWNPWLLFVFCACRHGVAVWGQPDSTPRERRFYILVTVITWLAVVWLQRPVPGFALELPEAIHVGGVVVFLLCVLLFFNGLSFSAIDGLLGVPGSVSAYSHGPETPLFTEGPYAQVRHPMYRAALLAGICSLLIHPNAAQLLWILSIGATFIAFIPVEEAQMTAARSGDYWKYKQQTPYRLFKGIW